jgi:hypothetical protein
MRSTMETKGPVSPWRSIFLKYNGERGEYNRRVVTLLVYGVCDDVVSRRELAAYFRGMSRLSVAALLGKTVLN